MANYYSSNRNGYRLRLELTYSNQDSTNNRTFCKTKLVLEAYTNGFNARTKLNYGVLGSSNNLSNEYASSNAADYPFRDCSSVDELVLGSWEDWVSHGTDGSGSFSSEAKFETWSQGYVWSCPQLTVSGTLSLPSYDRTPVTPSISSITRSSDGASITAFSYSGGVNNNGPAASYTIEYSTSSSFASIAGTSTSTSFSLPSANTSYYFRVKATNLNGTKYSLPSSIYYGVPAAPTFSSGQGAKTSSTVSGSIDLTWTQPSNTQTESPAVPTYDVYRNGTKVNTSPVTTTSYTDSGLVRGTSYEYTVVAVNGLGYNTTSSRSSVVSSIASGVPAQITGTIGISKVGRNVTVTCGQSPNNYGNIIIGYAVQYSTDNGETWSGGTAMTNRSHQYVLLPPALTYIFRCYAINSIGNGDTLSSTPVFVSAGGRRKLPNGDFEPTQTAKRYDSSRPEGQKWVDLNTAKRYSAAANNGAGDWVDLS